MADSLATATTPTERADLLVLVLSEIEDIVRWGSIAEFRPSSPACRVCSWPPAATSSAARWVDQKADADPDEKLLSDK